MTDKKTEASLTDLARADKAKHDGAAERSAQHLRDHAEKTRSAADRWAEFNRDLPGVIKEINAQIVAGDISLSAKAGAVDRDKPQKLGDVTVTVTRKGMAANFQTLNIEVYKSGVGKLTTIVQRPQKQIEDFELQDVDRDWIARNLDIFVRRALA